MPIRKSVFNFLLGLGRIAGKAAVKFASLNLLGQEIDLANMRRKMGALLNLSKEEMGKLELIDPTLEGFEVMVTIIVKALNLGKEPLIAVHMDPSKVAEALQYCSKRHCVLGGDTLSKLAKIPVPDKMTAGDFISKMGGIVPSDQ
eukprot:5825215-Prymnesium_polylepis.1